MTYVKISTTLDKETVRVIKEKGYKYTDLIKIGLKAKDMQQGYESFLLKMAERFENTAKIQEQITYALREQIFKIVEIKSDFEKLIKRQEILIESFNQALDRFDRLLEKQERFIDILDDKLTKILDNIEDLIKDKIDRLEREADKQSKMLNLSYRVIDNAFPNNVARELIRAIKLMDEEKINEILKLKDSYKEK